MKMQIRIERAGDNEQIDTFDIPSRNRHRSQVFYLAFHQWYSKLVSEGMNPAEKIITQYDDEKACLFIHLEDPTLSEYIVIKEYVPSDAEVLAGKICRAIIDKGYYEEQDMFPEVLDVLRSWGIDS
jgi:hypothetical protein